MTNLIKGIGTDLVEIARFEQSQDRQWRLAQKILSAPEMDLFKRRFNDHPARGTRFLASRFAAKEALIKALGTQKSMAPLRWHSIAVLPHASGAPQFHFFDALNKWMSEQHLQVHVSLSDTKTHALAFVILESN